MAIGTSLGAFFESDFHHQAGIETLLDNPNSTPDNNEISPNEVMPHPDEDAKIISVANKGINPNLLDNSLYPDEGDGSPRFDRYREDEPGVNELVRRNNKANRDTNDSMAKDPDKMLGIIPTHDNNIIPYDMLYRRPGGLINRT